MAAMSLITFRVLAQYCLFGQYQILLLSAGVMFVNDCIVRRVNMKFFCPVI